MKNVFKISLHQEKCVSNVFFFFIKKPKVQSVKK